MPAVPRYIIDASVATKWHLNDEEYTRPASKVLDDFKQGRIRLLAPDQIRHEVASSILKATRHPDRKDRVSLADGRRSVEAFLAWGIEMLRRDTLIPAAYDLAGSYVCSFYDGLYLAAAEMTNSPLLYADDKLRRNLGDRFPLALWIEDYPPPQ